MRKIWAQVFGSYERYPDAEESGKMLTSITITSDQKNYDIANLLEQRIMKELKNWSGDGKHVIASIKTGPYKNDERIGKILTDRLNQSVVFFGN